MKKLMVLFVALTFLATFSLIGCNQSPAAGETSRGERERKEHLEHLEHLERLEHLEHLHQKKNRRRISGISSPRGYTLITEWPTARSGGPSCPSALSATLPHG